MIEHKEFDFFVRSPEIIGKCQQLGCKRNGDWSVVAKDDHGKIILLYDNVCELHLFQTFLDAACGDF